MVVAVTVAWQVLFKLPKELASKSCFVLDGVKTSFLTVDMLDNYGSSLPVFIFLTSAVQLFMFVAYLIAHPEQEVTASSPIAGPEFMWMRVVDKFPGCTDLRPEWWRLVTYQFVHSGYQHIGFNVLLQTVFGLPINMASCCS